MGDNVCDNTTISNSDLEEKFQLNVINAEKALLKARYDQILFLKPKLEEKWIEFMKDKILDVFNDNIYFSLNFEFISSEAAKIGEYEFVMNHSLIGYSKSLFKSSYIEAKTIDKSITEPDLKDKINSLYLLVHPDKNLGNEIEAKKAWIKLKSLVSDGKTKEIIDLYNLSLTNPGDVIKTVNSQIDSDSKSTKEDTENIEEKYQQMLSAGWYQFFLPDSKILKMFITKEEFLEKKRKNQINKLLMEIREKTKPYYTWINGCEKMKGNNISYKSGFCLDIVDIKKKEGEQIFAFKVLMENVTSSLCNCTCERRVFYNHDHKGNYRNCSKCDEWHLGGC